MAYPTGSGSEILRRGAIHNLTNSITSFKFDGTSPVTGTATYAVPTNHIISLLSITVTDMSDTTNKKFSMWVSVAGSTTISLLQDQAVGYRDTYVFDDRIVLHPTDLVKLVASASSNYDVFYTYIDQDWT